MSLHSSGHVFTAIERVSSEMINHSNSSDGILFSCLQKRFKSTATKWTFSKSLDWRNKAQISPGNTLLLQSLYPENKCLTSLVLILFDIVRVFSQYWWGAKPTNWIIICWLVWEPYFRSQLVCRVHQPTKHTRWSPWLKVFLTLYDRNQERSDPDPDFAALLVLILYESGQYLPSSRRLNVDCVWRILRSRDPWLFLYFAHTCMIQLNMGC